MAPMTADEAEVHMKAGGNVGIRLRDDQLVIDVDPRRAASDTDYPMSAFLERLGLSDADWPVVSTGGGGRHYYLKKPEGTLIRSELAAEFPGLEFKSVGSQVVASGSVHPKTLELYSVIPLQDDLANAPRAPERLLELIARNRPTEKANDSAQLSPEQLAKCLAVLDPKNFRDHDRWRALMMSCHHATAAHGREEFITWSVSDPEFANHAEIVGTRWDSLDPQKTDGNTVGTLFHELAEIKRGDLIDLMTRVPVELDFDDDLAKTFRPPLALALRKSSKGDTANNYRNCMQLIHDSNLGLAYDELSQRSLLRAETLPWNQDIGREVNDDLIRIIRLFLIERWSTEFSKENVLEACFTLARMASFNPVVEYLDTLNWDGKKRLDRWLIDYLGADDTPFNRNVARLVLLAAVRRAKRPGTKFDQVLILEGQQGSGKSSALHILGGDWHSDAELGRVDSKEAPILLQGCWIVELGEMTAMNRSETEALKAFLSRSEDRFRAPYDRTSKTEPRRCIFIGTTNSDAYLRDLTGNRRFWPVRTTTIDKERLKQDRDQIWAETAQLEASGASLTLASELWDDATVEQESRLVTDPWTEELMAYLQQRQFTRVHTRMLMTNGLGLSIERQNQHVGKRLREVMSSLGWRYSKAIRIDGVNAAGYYAPNVL